MFGKRRLEGTLALIADIGDGSIGVCLARFPKKGLPHIIEAHRTFLPIENRTPEQARSAIIKVLEEKLQTLFTPPSGSGKKPLSPERIIVSLHAPWSRYRTAHAESTFDAPRTITKELINERARAALAETSTVDKNNSIETGVSQVFLNGYPTGNPLGKKAQRIRVLGFQSDGDMAITGDIVRVCGAVLPGRTPIFRSYARLLSSLMHERLPDAHRFLFCVIGSSVSEISIIRPEGLTQQVIVPEGWATILKRIAPNGLPEESLSVLKMLSTEQCSTETCTNMKEALARAEPELVRVFGEVFATLAAKERLPNVLVLTAPYELAPWMQGFFSRIDFAQFTITTQPFVVEEFSPEQTTTLVSWEEGVRPDTTLGVAVAGVHILEQ